MMNHGPGQGQGSDQNQLIVHMLDRDGRPADRVDLSTPEGANRFLQSDYGNMALSRFLGQADEVRQKLAGNNHARRKASHKLIGLYTMIYNLASETSDEAFGVLDPDTEHVALIRHIKDAMEKIVAAPAWKRTGKLAEHDEEMLACLIAFTKRPPFVQKALSEGVLESMVRWIEAIENHKLPSPEATEIVVSVVGNAYVTLLFSADDNGEPSADAEQQSLKTLEKTGILTQVIRISTQPTPHQNELTGHLKLLDGLARCVNLVRKRLVEGQPAGDMLKAVLSGKDGFKPTHRRNPHVVRRLSNLQRIAGGLTTQPGTIGTMQTCRNCAKVDEDNSFMRCSICKATYYCSKECQKADWKQHKKTCQSNNKQQEKQSQSCDFLAVSYVRDHSLFIMHEMAEKTRHHSNKEWALELDFMADDTGVAPALQKPPVMRIQPVKGYLEGDREFEPDWFDKGTSLYEANVRQFLVGVQDAVQRMTEDRVLTIMRHPDGAPSVGRICFQDPTTMQPIFGPVAMNAYRQVILDGTAGPELLDALFSRGLRDPMLMMRNAVQSPFERIKSLDLDRLGDLDDFDDLYS